MASSSQNSTLPQGFSVYQPALGAQLQFFPALGSQELDDLVHAYVTGPASIKEKRASISVDFLEYAQMTGQTFKFYPVYTVPSLSSASASPVQDSASSFNSSLVNSPWDWNQLSRVESTSSRSSNHSNSRRVSKTATSISRHQTSDFSHLPGMQILTKDGQDVTNASSRCSKTKEQRDHAHLMRIIKACDSCRRKKIRCDPSHKKRRAAEIASQPASKHTKKQRAVPQAPQAPRAPQASLPPTVVAPKHNTGAPPIPVGIDFDPSFTFGGMGDFDIAAMPTDDWEQFVQYPPADVSEDYDFFFDPEGYLSSQSSSSASPLKVLTPSSGQESIDDSRLDVSRMDTYGLGSSGLDESRRDVTGLDESWPHTSRLGESWLDESSLDSSGRDESRLYTSRLDESGANVSGLDVSPLREDSNAQLQTIPQLGVQDSSGLTNSYVDFNLFSPGSSWSEDDRMVSIAAPSIPFTEDPRVKDIDTQDTGSQDTSTQDTSQPGISVGVGVGVSAAAVAVGGVVIKSAYAYATRAMTSIIKGNRDDQHCDVPEQQSSYIGTASRPAKTDTIIVSEKPLVSSGGFYGPKLFAGLIRRLGKMMPLIDGRMLGVAVA